MNLEKKKWAFTEFLGNSLDIENALQALEKVHVLHGKPFSKEEKGDKRFIQYYACDENVGPLNSEEAEIYQKAAVQNHILIEYSCMGYESQDFPEDGEHDFSIQYREWWMMD